MSVASDLHSLAKFYADHPALPVPSVHVLVDASWESDDGPKQIAAFIDGLDTLPVAPRAGWSSTTTLRRSFGSIEVRATVETKQVAEVPEPHGPVYATPAEIIAAASCDLGAGCTDPGCPAHADELRGCEACERTPFADELAQAKGSES